MARCRYCAESGWTVRTNQHGLCKGCGTTVQRDIEAKLAQLKNALVYVRCASSPETQLSFCELAIETAQKLLVYEERKLAEVRPRPSAVIQMLQIRREEVQANGGAVRHASRSVRNEGSRVQGISPPDREMPRRGSPAGSVPPPMSVGATPQTWWAWGSNVSDSTGEERGREHRGTERTSVDCYALLQPGGVRGRLENLSSGGLFLRASRVQPEGTAVRVIVSTADGPATAEGVVRWTRGSDSNQNGQADQGMGIEFTEISRELWSYLCSQLALPSAAIGVTHESLAF